MGRSVEDVMVYALEVGLPSTWDDVPPEFQTDLVVMDRLEDDAFWAIARSKKGPTDRSRYDELLERNQDNLLTDQEKHE